MIIKCQHRRCQLKCIKSMKQNSMNIEFYFNNKMCFDNRREVLKETEKNEQIRIVSANFIPFKVRHLFTSEKNNMESNLITVEMIRYLFAKFPYLAAKTEIRLQK